MNWINQTPYSPNNHRKSERGGVGLPPEYTQHSYLYCCSNLVCSYVFIQWTEPFQMDPELLSCYWLFMVKPAALCLWNAIIFNRIRNSLTFSYAQINTLALLHPTRAYSNNKTTCLLIVFRIVFKLETIRRLIACSLAYCAPTTESRCWSKLRLIIFSL